MTKKPEPKKISTKVMKKVSLHDNPKLGKKVTAIRTLRGIRK
jgi:hypothetical protein